MSDDGPVRAEYLTSIERVWYACGWLLQYLKAMHEVGGGIGLLNPPPPRRVLDLFAECNPEIRPPELMLAIDIVLAADPPPICQELLSQLASYTLMLDLTMSTKDPEP